MAPVLKENLIYSAIIFCTLDQPLMLLSKPAITQPVITQ